MKKALNFCTDCIYTPVLFLFSLTYLPKFISRLNQADDQGRMLRERFGFSRNSFSGPVIWIHAVSVGEVLATRELIRMIHIAYPNHQILLTTTTPTGQTLAKKMECEFIRAAYFPMDFKFAVRNFLNTMKPQLIVIMETEIWPNLIREAKRRQIPIGIVNGRISDRAMKRYRWIKQWCGSLMGTFQFVLACSERDRARFAELGVPGNKVQVTGNMKFDSEANRNSVEASEIKSRFAIQDELLIVAGSTHEGEEEMILRVFRDARNQKNNLRLVLAPRHIERAKQVKALAEGIADWKVSLLSANGAVRSDILILDTMGELSKFYGIADVVFVGGSLIPHGGQNPIEVARERRALIHGPHVQNFSDLYALLDEKRGAILVRTQQELSEQVNELLNDEPKRKSIGLEAFRVVDGLRGASQRNLKLLEPWLTNQRSL